MRMISALAFCPKNKVTAAFETLYEIILEEAIPIMDYFEDTYIGKPHRRRRRSPIFDIDIWNMYSRVSNDLSKSNNSVEGWNHSFQSSLTCDHPNICFFSENSTKGARTSRRYTYVSKCLPGIPRKFKRKNTKIFLCALRTPWLRLTTVRF